LCFPVLILGLAEIQTRIQQRSKRIIQFKDNKIIVKPAKSGLVLWKRVAEFQFEPIPEMSGAMKLKLFLHGRANQKLSGRAFWATVLENRSQVQELTRSCKPKKTKRLPILKLNFLERPAQPALSAPFPFLGMSLYFAGVFLLLHGMPMLLAMLNHDHHDSGGNSNLTPVESANLARFISRHFSSREEFRHFYLILSICLTIAGVTLLALGWWLLNRKQPLTHTEKRA